MIEFQIIDDTPPMDVNLIDNTEKIEVDITDYNDKEVRDDIEELKQTKVDKIEGKGLSTNDFTNNDKNKLDSLENYDDSEVRALIDTKQPRGDYALHSEIPKKVSELENDEGYITEYIETDPTVPNHVKSISQNDISVWNNKADMSDIPDVSNFVTKSVDDLLNYYLKSETYTKTEVNNLIGTIQQFHYEIVEELPSVGANNILYLTPRSTSEESNIYDEYVYANNNWEKIGSTDIDLSNYVTITDLNTALNNYTTTSELTTLLGTKQDKIDNSHKISADLVDDTSTTNKFVTANEKNKLNGIEEGAEVNVQADWNETNSSSDAYIKNKPTLSTVATTGNYNDLINKPNFVLTTAERIRSIFG